MAWYCLVTLCWTSITRPNDPVPSVLMRSKSSRHAVFCSTETHHNRRILQPDTSSKLCIPQSFLSFSLQISTFCDTSNCKYILPRDAVHSAVLPWQVVHPSVRDVDVLLPHIRWNTSKKITVISRRSSLSADPIFLILNNPNFSRSGVWNKTLSYCWETVRRESMPRIAEMEMEMTT